MLTWKRRASLGMRVCVTASEETWKKLLYMQRQCKGVRFGMKKINKVAEQDVW